MIVRIFTRSRLQPRETFECALRLPPALFLHETMSKPRRLVGWIRLLTTMDTDRSSLTFWHQVCGQSTDFHNFLESVLFRDSLTEDCACRFGYFHTSFLCTTTSHLTHRHAACTAGEEGPSSHHHAADLTPAPCCWLLIAEDYYWDFSNKGLPARGTSSKQFDILWRFSSTRTLGQAG